MKQSTLSRNTVFFFQKRNVQNLRKYVKIRKNIYCTVNITETIDFIYARIALYWTK